MVTEAKGYLTDQGFFFLTKEKAMYEDLLYKLLRKLEKNLFMPANTTPQEIIKLLESESESITAFLQAGDALELQNQEEEETEAEELAAMTKGTTHVLPTNSKQDASKNKDA